VFRLVGGGGNEMAAISVGAHGTTTAFPALAEGTATIGLSSRRINGPEAGLADLRDSPDEYILALDGLIVIVHPDNPLRSLSLDQIAAVFAGRITSWAALGGPDQRINVYVPDDRSGTQQVFEAMVMQPRRLTVVEAAERLEDHADLSDLVSIDPAGIGLTGFAYARGSRMLAIRQQCGLVSFPTSFSLKTEEYPLGRRLYAYGSGRAPLSTHARGLIDFALSDAAQPIIAEAGFVDRDIEGQGIEVQGARLAHSLTSPEEFSLPVFREMLNETIDAERLSITFRFTLGSSRLEARSQSEAERFARMLAGGAFPGKDILLIGFADSVGEFAVNQDLAVRRAQRVLDTLKESVAAGALDGVPILVQSYGELTPVGCNETAEGRELNRRVEVWIRDKRG
jgi:phosphate transport system substrate-binding protein